MICDERVRAQADRIYKRCFYIMSAAFLIDILLKFNLFGILFTLTDTLALFMWIEAAVLLAIFYTAFFSLAKRGIAPGIEEEGKKPPRLKYVGISACLGAAISILMWTLRWIVFDWSISEIRGMVAVLLIVGIYLITFCLTFAVAYFSLSLSYRIALKAIKRELDE
ncbi:MAG: hypothetical protein E7663_00810 [Ruminococcaceae bacterium]|nr:hypothetical protein [Oscillospiraceae bacterium]